MLAHRLVLVALVVLLVLVGSLPSASEEAPRATEPPGGMPPEEQLVTTLRAWLAEGDGLHAAWAGWIVAQRRLSALAGAVEERLVRAATGQGPREHGYFVDQALLDALVRIGGTVPGETLRRLAPAHVEIATVLLCRRPAVDPAHLAVFRIVARRLDFEAYVALGNVLARWRVPAFTAQILGNLELRRRVRIWDEDPPYPPFRRPGDSVPG